MKRIDVCLACDDNYSKMAAAVILSALDNKNNDDELVFHILHANLSDAAKEFLRSLGNVELHKVDNSLFEPYFNNGVCKHVSIPTLYRLILPSLLPQIDKIIYLDCDLVVLKSLSPLFDSVSNDDNYIAAACVDYAQKHHYERMNFVKTDDNFYFNAGVILFNLKKMREENTQDKLFNYLKENFEHLSYSDQDVLNAVLFERVKKLPQEFNLLTPNIYFENTQDTTIAHFAGVKPWKVGFYNPYRELYWKYFIQAGADVKKFNQIKFWHKRIMQYFFYIKMYPLFFIKEDRRHNFMRIVKNIPWNFIVG